jgi:hypothetical protein
MIGRQAGRSTPTDGSALQGGDADEGVNMLEAWLNTGMAAPYTMASTTIAVPEPAELLLLGSGVVFLLLMGRRRIRS